MNSTIQIALYSLLILNAINAETYDAITKSHGKKIDVIVTDEVDVQNSFNNLGIKPILFKYKGNWLVSEQGKDGTMMYLLKSLNEKNCEDVNKQNIMTKLTSNGYGSGIECALNPDRQDEIEEISNYGLGSRPAFGGKKYKKSMKKNKKSKKTMKKGGKKRK